MPHVKNWGSESSGATPGTQAFLAQWEDVLTDQLGALWGTGDSHVTGWKGGTGMSRKAFMKTSKRYWDHYRRTA